MTRGFTIVEMLTVLACIIVLAVIIYPVTQRALGKAKSSKCLNNLKNIGIGLNGYLGDHNMVLPTLVAARENRNDNVAALDNTLNAYVGNNVEVFLCPADSSQGGQSGTSYYWDSILNGQSVTSLNFLTLTSSLQKIPVISDKEGWHHFSPSQVNILYADGHVTEGLQFSLTP